MPQSVELLLETDETLRIPASVVDFDSFRRWTDRDDFPERGRISWFDGELVIDMNAEEVDSHIRVKSSIAYDLTTFVRTHDLGEVLADGARVVHDEARVSHEPDAVFVSRESIRAGRVVYREITEGSGRLMEVAGSPDLVVEVVSNSSVRKDNVLLRDRYFRAGIPEYWIVDARGETIEFTVLVPDAGGYREVAADDDGYVRSTVLEAAFRLERTGDPDGLTRYDLRSR